MRGCGRPAIPVKRSTWPPGSCERRQGGRPEADGSVLPALFAAVVNGFLVFSSVSGLTNVGAAVANAEQPSVTAQETVAPDRLFLTPWP